MLCNRPLRAALVVLFVLFNSACYVGAADSLAMRVLPDTLLKRITTDGPGTPVVVFNPLSWARTDAVDVESPFHGESPFVRVVDSSGKAYPARALGDHLSFTARNVPPLGYKVFWVIRSSKPMPTAIKCTPDVIENQFFRVTLNKSKSVITGIYDKVNARQMMPQGAQALLQVALDGFNANVDAKSMSVMMDSGPARGLLILDHDYGKSPLLQELILNEGVPRIDIHLTSEWQQSGLPESSLRAVFPTVLKQAKPISGGIQQFANNKLIPGLRWLDCQYGNYGVSLVSDQAYSCSLINGCLTATLLKQADSDGKIRECNYSLFTHKGDWRKGRVFEQAFEVARPLVARVTTKHAGELPKAFSLLSLSKGTYIAELMPSMSDNRSLILHFYETSAKYTCVSATVNLSGIELQKLDDTEKPIPALGLIQERSFTIDLPAASTSSYLFSLQ